VTSAALLVTACSAALLLQPAQAQVTSSSASANPSGAPGAKIPSLSTSYVFGSAGCPVPASLGYAFIAITSNKTSCLPSPRVNVAMEIGGPTAGPYPNGNTENTIIDGVAINGFATQMGERYDFNGGRLVPVLNNEFAAIFGGSAYNGASNNTIGGMQVFTTENMSSTHNGGGVSIYAFMNGPNGSRKPAISVNAGGKGAVIIGATSVAPLVGPVDSGYGTLHVAGDVYTDAHYMTYPARSQPTLPSCGVSPRYLRGADQAGAITTGTGGPTSCRIHFVNTWKSPVGTPSSPVCMAQVFGTSTPTAFVSSETSTDLTVNFSAPASGVTFQYICMGVG
jgi:hypothetical protein